MILYTEERYLLNKLLVEGSFDLYSIYNETNFSTAQIARFIKSYSRKLYIVLFKDKVILTPVGRFCINRNKLFANSSDLYWKRIPAYMLTKRSNINEPLVNIEISRELAKRVTSIKGCSRPRK